MAHPQALSGLTTREAIADALTRAVVSFDMNDAGLLESAFASEFNFSHPAGEFKQVRMTCSIILLIFCEPFPSLASL